MLASKLVDFSRLSLLGDRGYEGRQDPLGHAPDHVAPQHIRGKSPTHAAQVERHVAPRVGIEQRAERDPERRVHLDARRDARADRKSTRLNSSHTVISYAVFCLKKKKKKK